MLINMNDIKGVILLKRLTFKVGDVNGCWDRSGQTNGQKMNGQFLWPIFIHSKVHSNPNYTLTLTTP